MLHTLGYGFNRARSHDKIFVVISNPALDRPLSPLEPSNFNPWAVWFQPLNRPLSSFRPSTFTSWTVQFPHKSFNIEDRLLFEGPSTSRQKIVHFQMDCPLSTDRPLSRPSTFPLLDHPLFPDSFAMFICYELFMLFVLFAQCELFARFAVRTVRTHRTVRTVRCSHCSNNLAGRP